MFQRIIALLLALGMLLALCGCTDDATAPGGETPQTSEESSLSGSSASQSEESSSSAPEEPSSQSEESSSEPESSSESSSQELAPPAESSGSFAEPSSSSQPAEESSQAEAPEGTSSQAEPEPEPEPEPAAPKGPPAYLGVGSPRVPDDGEYHSGVEYDVLESINLEREFAGVAPVEWDDNLADAARIRVVELYKHDYIAHTRPNGDRWLTVLKADVPVGYSAAGEIPASIATQDNEYKISDPDYWVNQWVNSQAHYDCMLNAGYTHAGVGVIEVYNEDDGLTHGVACTIFAKW